MSGLRIRIRHRFWYRTSRRTRNRRYRNNPVACVCCLLIQVSAPLDSQVGHTQTYLKWNSAECGAAVVLQSNRVSKHLCNASFAAAGTFLEGLEEAVELVDEQFAEETRAAPAHDRHLLVPALLRPRLKQKVLTQD